MHESFEYTPGVALAPYVERAVGYLHTGLPAGVHVGMPSCSLTLVVPLDEPLTLTDGDDEPRAYGSVLAGLYASPTHIHHFGHQHGIQLALRPAAARALFGCRPADLAGACFEWVDVFGPTAHGLRERLHETAGWAERLALVEQALTARLSEEPAPAPEVDEAWRLVTVSGGRLPVRDIARRVGWSPRHLEQQFAKEYGLRPKTAARVRRFERSVSLVSDRRRRLSEVAAVCGYADQAHLARDWRSLAGLPPSRWRDEDVLAVTDEVVPSGQPSPGPGRQMDRGVRAEPRARQEEQP